MSRSCSAAYALVAYRWRSLCSVHVAGRMRRPICETESGTMWPPNLPGNAYCPVAAHRSAIARARSSVMGTVRVLSPFPRTKRFQPSASS